MTTVWELTKNAISTLNVPYAASKYEPDSGQELPDVFIVYFLVVSTPEQHADNEEVLRASVMQVNVFSRSGLIALPDVDAAMAAQGFLKGNMVEIPLDPDTRHFGLGTEYMY